MSHMTSLRDTHVNSPHFVDILPIADEERYYVDEEFGRWLHREVPGAFSPLKAQADFVSSMVNSCRSPKRSHYVKDVPFLSRGYSVQNGYCNYVDGHRQMEDEGPNECYCAPPPPPQEGYRPLSSNDLNVYDPALQGEVHDAMDAMEGIHPMLDPKRHNKITSRERSAAYHPTPRSSLRGHPNRGVGHFGDPTAPPPLQSQPPPADHYGSYYRPGSMLRGSTVSSPYRSFSPH